MEVSVILIKKKENMRRNYEACALNEAAQMIKDWVRNKDYGTICLT